jgi:hypothetical protein
MRSLIASRIHPEWDGHKKREESQRSEAAATTKTPRHEEIQNLSLNFFVSWCLCGSLFSLCFFVFLAAIASLGT